MLMTYSQRRRCLLGFRKSLAPAASAMIAALIWSGLASSVGGEERAAVPPFDRGVLSEIAQDVLTRGATGPDQSVPEPTAPGAEAAAEFAGVGSAPDPDPPITHIAPAREGISVPIPPKSAAPTEGHRGSRDRQAINPTRGGRRALKRRGRSASRRAFWPRRPGSTRR